MHFSNEFIDFFKGLAANNSKDYFDQNRKTYENYVKKPWYEFVTQVVERLSVHDKKIKGLAPKDIVFRINRDIRFSKDKTPYKLHLSGVFSGGGRKNMRIPGMYLQLGIGEAWMGGGMYAPEKADVQAIREAILRNPKKISNLMEAPDFASTYGEIKGAKNKIIPSEFKEAAKNQALLFNKQWYFIKEFNNGEELILRPDLLDVIETHYLAGKPWNDFLESTL